MKVQRRSIVTMVGVAVAALVWVPGLPLPYVGVIERVLLLGLLVVVRLGLRLHVLHRGNAATSLRYHIVNVLLLPAGLAVAISFLWPPGVLPAILALPWFVVTSMIAHVGFKTRRGAWSRPDLLCSTASLMYIIVGGAALVLARAGITLGFPEVIIVLTAVHFHFAGFAGPLIAAEVLHQTRKKLSSRLSRAIAGGVAVAPVFVAIGITFTNWIELPAALAVASAYMILAAVMARSGVGVRALLLISAIALLAAMATAIAYAVGHFMENEIILITDMARTHGILNSFGFVLCGLLGLLIHKRRRPAAIPFSTVFGRWNQSIKLDEANQPLGAVDDFETFRSLHFSPNAVHPAISRFYEQAGSYRLDLMSTWRVPFPGKFLFWIFSRVTGEFNFPHTDELHRVHTAFYAKPKHLNDPRPGARVCVRRYDSTSKEILYVPFYAYHRARGVTYMNVAFPTPLGNITGILSPENLSNGAMRLACSTDLPGDEGIYFAGPWGAVRLPILSNITLWPAAGLPQTIPSQVKSAEPEVVALNDIAIMGVHVCSVYYAIKQTGSSTAGAECN